MLHSLIAWLVDLYVVLLVLRAVLSFLSMTSQRRLPWPLVKFVYDVTEPLLQPVRNALRRYQSNSPLDFSPLVLVLLLQLLAAVATRLLSPLGL